MVFTKTRIMEKEKPKFDFESFKQEALAGLYAGQSLNGEKGVFGPLIKHLLESALEGELKHHLESEQQEGRSNRRNGKTSKKVKSSAGLLEVEGTRDRAGTFQPELLPKRQVVMSDDLESKIIGMYSRGMSLGDIQDQVEEMYGFKLSKAKLSSITDAVLPTLEAWRKRPLESVYAIIWLDAMFYKVRHEGKVVTRAMYSVLGLSFQGNKEVLGIYIMESEGARQWLNVLGDLKERGVEDILIACVDGLNGFPKAIGELYPKTNVQLCVVHQIRNSARFVPDKHIKAFMKDLKMVYQAPGRELAEQALLELEQGWGQRYPQAVKPWMEHWEQLSTYFEHPPEIRKVMYTTNTIEAYHRQIRKITKTKGAFASDNALLKLAFLAIMDMEKAWKRRAFNWKSILSQFMMIYEDRIPMQVLD
jgi:transposase-like protein